MRLPLPLLILAGSLVACSGPEGTLAPPPSSPLERADLEATGQARFYAWTPDGALIFRWWGGDGNGQAFRLDAPGTEAERITDFEAFISGWAPRPGQPDTVLMAVNQPQDRRFQDVFLNPATGDWRPVGETRHRSSPPRWSPDGHVATWNYRAPDRETVDIVVGDPGDLATRRVLWTAPGATTPMDWSADGQTILLMTYTSATEQQLRFISAETGEVTRIDDEELAAGYLDPRLDSEGDHVLTATDGVDGLYRFGRIDVATGEFEDLFPDRTSEVEEWALSSARDRAAVAFNVGGATEVEVIELTTGARSRLDGLPTGVVDSFGFSEDGTSLGVVLQSWSSPGSIWSVDMESGAVREWFSIPAPSAERLIEPTVEQFPTFDTVGSERRRLDAVVWAPDGQGPRPVIVYLHGGPTAQIRPVFSSDFQYWAAGLGYAVVAPNVRGSEGYGREFIRLDDGAKRVDAVRDVGATLDWIATDPRFDARRVVVAGPSYGGLLSLAAATQYSDRLRGVVVYYAIADLIGLADSRQEESLRAYTVAEYGDVSLDSVRETLETISPLQNASSITVPLFVAHGAEDDRAPVEAVDALVDAVRESGVDVRYLRIEGQGHGFVDSDIIATVGAAEEAFLLDLLR